MAVKSDRAPLGMFRLKSKEAKQGFGTQLDLFDF